MPDDGSDGVTRQMEPAQATQRTKTHGESKGDPDFHGKVLLLNEPSLHSNITPSTRL